MASSRSDSARMEQMIKEFFAKSLHIILESRSPYRSSRNFSGEQTFSSPSSSSSSSSSVRPRDKWFNLALQECPEVLENLDLWRQSNLEPMIVDVVLVKRTVNWDPGNFSPKSEVFKNSSSKDTYLNCWNFDRDALGSGGNKEKIVERWVVQYVVKKSKGCCPKGGKRSGGNVLSAFYKKSMLLLRSLYATVRLLPTYKIFRDLNVSGQIRSFTLARRVSSFVEPFTTREEAAMQRFGFAPVDTSGGRLCLSVQYRSSVHDVSSEPSTPMSPQLIQDYVGSPLADPLKRFPSLPVAHRSPSWLPFSRRHSWSYDQYLASPPYVTSSPSPTHSEPCTSASNPATSRFPHPDLPPHPPDPSHAHKDSFEECALAPNYSPSPSASPPVFMPESLLSKALLRSDSAPVNIPGLRFHNNHALFKNQNSASSSPLRGVRCESLRSYKTLGPSRTNEIVEKVSCEKDENTRLSRIESAQLLFSKRSSRSFHDDFDEAEYACPFDVEDNVLTAQYSRPESFDPKGNIREPLEPGRYLPVRKSSCAAIGALVDLLKKAPPLCPNFSTSVASSQTSKSDIRSGSLPEPNQTCPERSVQDVAPPSDMSSTLLTSRTTTTDALEELRGYKEMKSMLLSESERSCNWAASSPANESSGKFTH